MARLGPLTSRAAPPCCRLCRQVAAAGLSGSHRATHKVWCGVVWCGAVQCGAVQCGVVWCGGVWCGVVWCRGGVVSCARWCAWWCTAAPVNVLLGSRLDQLLQTGMLYEALGTLAAYAMQLIAAEGGIQLTVADVIASNGR